MNYTDLRGHNDRVGPCIHCSQRETSVARFRNLELDVGNRPRNGRISPLTAIVHSPGPKRVHDASLRLLFVWGTVLAYGPYKSLVPGWQRSLSSYQGPPGRPLSLDVERRRRVLKHSRDQLHIGEI